PGLHTFAQAGVPGSRTQTVTSPTITRMAALPITVALQPEAAPARCLGGVGPGASLADRRPK
ncbi:MAG: hypothetical protein AAFO79_08480, partial [Pseudomonadota bacterium]